MLLHVLHHWFKKNIYVNASLFRTTYDSCQWKILSLVAQPWRKIIYAHNNLPSTVWVPHLSKMIHSIGAKIKFNIPWIARKVLLMDKVKMFPLPTISRISDLSIPLSLDMPKQEMSFPSIREHTLQVINDR
jgi:hypothetical protein